MTKLKEKLPTMYEDKYIIEAIDNQTLAKAIAKMEKKLGAKIEPPYVVRIKPGTRLIKKDAFMDNNDIEVVIFPDDVMMIEDGRNYYDYELHDQVTIGAFIDCRNLKRLVFSGNLREIGMYAFAGCSSRFLHVGLPTGPGRAEIPPTGGCHFVTGG